jgi:hypothetical protein
MDKICEQEIQRLELGIEKLRKLCLKNNDQPRKFKIGDWVCYNHGEYPGYFSREVAPITHISYQYDKEGIFQTKYSVGGGHEDRYLRFAHPDEIAYSKTGLPFVYNKKKEEYELIEIKDGYFKIGDLIDSRVFSSMTPKKFITFLMDTNFLNQEGLKILSTIYEKL